MARSLPRRLVRSLVTALAVGGSVAAVSRRRTTPIPHLAGRPGTVTSADGTSLHVVTAGPQDAEAVVVLVHGWGMAASFWEHQAADLAVDHRVVAYDQRGHGHSGVPGALGTTTDGLGADVHAVLQSIPGDRPVVLVGHSMGAMSIIAWAAAHADDRVVGAVLCNTGIHGLVPACAGALGLPEARTLPVVNAILHSRAPLDGLPPAVVRPFVAYVAHGPGAERDAVATTTDLFRRTDPAVRGGFGGHLCDLDLREAATALDVPAVVVTGPHDRLTPPRLADALVAQLPQARLEVLDRAGHQAPLDAPDTVTRLIRRHLAEVAHPDRREAA